LEKIYPIKSLAKDTVTHSRRRCGTNNKRRRQVLEDIERKLMLFITIY
jgi:hypothetical protein